MPLSSKAKRRLIIAAVGVATLLAVIFTLQRMLLFPARMVRAHEAAGDSIQGRQQLWLQLDRGRVEAWLLPGDGVDAEHPGPLVIFAHGNGESIDQWPAVLRRYRERGISVLLPEYRGYGRSGGSPSEDAIVSDFIAFYDLVVARPEIDGARVVVHGRSLGGGVVGGVVKQRPVAAMIMQSTFTSVADLAWQKWFVPRFLILDPFDNLEAMRGFDGPSLVVHGRSDQLIPVSHAEALHEAGSNARLVLFEGGHNNTPPSWPALWTEIDVLLDDAGVLPLPSLQ